MGYRGSVNKKKVLESIVYLWILPAVMSIGPLLGWGQFVYNPKFLVCEQEWAVSNHLSTSSLLFLAVFTFFIPLVVLIRLNVALLKTVRQKLKLIKATQLQVATDLEKRRIKDSMKEYKATIDVVLIIGVFLLCYLPLWIAGIYRRIVGKDNSPVAQSIVNGIYASTTIWNPIIYSIRRRAFRKAVYRLLRCKRFVPGQVNGN